VVVERIAHARNRIAGLQRASRSTGRAGSSFWRMSIHTKLAGLLPSTTASATPERRIASHRRERQTAGMAMPSQETIAATIRPLTENRRGAGVFCDIDGTLAPIAPRPEDARVSAPVSRLIGELSGRYACVACVSGRPATEARCLVGQPGIVYAGLHGAELLSPAEARPRLAPAWRPWVSRVQHFAAAHGDQLREVGVRVEDKGPIVALHWRGAPDESAALSRLRAIADAAAGVGLATQWGRKVLEVRPPVPISKGDAIRRLTADCRPEAALFAGDDVTDLDAFDALDALVAEGRLHAAVRVGVTSAEGPSALAERADIVVDGVESFALVLEGLLQG
jgi:trehalose 6-phosphate phosphatase